VEAIPSAKLKYEAGLLLYREEGEKITHEPYS
jgi:hypothetical protein